MGYIKFLIVLCAVLLSRAFPTALGIQQKYLPDLRLFRVGGLAGRFAVNRTALERELQKRKKQDPDCGEEVKLQLPEPLEHSTYDVSHQGEVIFLHETITDFTLAAELPENLRDEIATSYHFLSVAIPVIIGNEKQSGLMFSMNFLTNSTKKVLYPYLTNVGHQPKQVDSIVEEDNGTVTIRLRDDVMIYQVQDEVTSKSASSVGKDFDKISGKVITATAYPLPFDWGCEHLGARISFCQALNQFECDLEAIVGDVCTLTSTSTSERYPTTVVILKMTGIFRDMFPFLAETLPSESFEAEIIDRFHTTGIKYPCLE